MKTRFLLAEKFQLSKIEIHNLQLLRTFPHLRDEHLLDWSFLLLVIDICTDLFLFLLSSSVSVE